MNAKNVGHMLSSYDKRDVAIDSSVSFSDNSISDDKDGTNAQMH